MPLDALCLAHLVRELNGSLLGARIDKVQQPAKDQIVLLLKGGKRLYVNGGSTQSRIQLTEQKRENPSSPPMFCMLLRKYLTGAVIRAFEQVPMERIVRIRMDTVDELGIRGRHSLVLEAMGRRSNIILLDEEGLIIDCLRRVDFAMSRERQVLPGMKYYLPENTKESINSFAIAVRSEARLSDTLLDYAGISPLIAREIAFRATGSTDTRLCELNADAEQAVISILSELASCVKENNFAPYLLVKDGKPFDFSFLPILQYGPDVASEEAESFSQLLDRFYFEKEQQERIRQKGQDLLRAAQNARDRVRRKLEKQRLDYAATQDRDSYRKCGELITANLYRMQKGESILICEDYYDIAQTEIKIKLDPLLSPQQNAAKYYKHYQKAKTAEQHLRILIAAGEEELKYLDSILDELSRAETEQDFIEIRAEMTQGGYLRLKKDERKAAKRPSPYREFISRGGLRISVGRNNVQNDRLTFSDTARSDLWLHTQKLHGAHVVLRDAQIAAEEDIYDAAMIAAYYSEGKDSSSVAVDCTFLRYVKKASGAKAGQVIYTNQRTIFVTPERSYVEALENKA